LLGDAVEDLRQRLVDGIESNCAVDAGVDVDVDFCIARQCEQDVAGW
jgi:hypothetical protein